MDQLQNNKSKNTTTYEKIIAATALFLLVFFTFIGVCQAVSIAVICLSGDNALYDSYLLAIPVLVIATLLLPHINYWNKNGVGHDLMSVIFGKHYNKYELAEMSSRADNFILITLVICIVEYSVLISLTA